MKRGRAFLYLVFLWMCICVSCVSTQQGKTDGFATPEPPTEGTVVLEETAPSSAADENSAELPPVPAPEFALAPEAEPAPATTTFVHTAFDLQGELHTVYVFGKITQISCENQLTGETVYLEADSADYDRETTRLVFGDEESAALQELVSAYGAENLLFKITGEEQNPPSFVLYTMGRGTPLVLLNGRELKYPQDYSFDPAARLLQLKVPFSPNDDSYQIAWRIDHLTVDGISNRIEKYASRYEELLRKWFSMQR